MAGSAPDGHRLGHWVGLALVLARFTRGTLYGVSLDNQRTIRPWRERGRYFTMYLPVDVRLWARDGAIAIAFSVVVAEIEIGPV